MMDNSIDAVVKRAKAEKKRRIWKDPPVSVGQIRADGIVLALEVERLQAIVDPLKELTADGHTSVMLYWHKDIEAARSKCVKIYGLQSSYRYHGKTYAESLAKAVEAKRHKESCPIGCRHCNETISEAQKALDEKKRNRLIMARKMACDLCSYGVPVGDDGYHDDGYGHRIWCDAEFGEEPTDTEGGSSAEGRDA